MPRGLLGEVVWLSASELAGNRFGAACWHHVDGDSTLSTLGAAMSRHHREEVWLAALRHPEGPGDPISPEQAWRTEVEAHSALLDLLGSGITFRSLTVRVAATGARSEIADCSPIWDFHLIHGSHVEAHESLPRRRAADRAPLSLCAMVALCASGGWRGASHGLEIERDKHDARTNPVRFVHCQMRVLHTPAVSLSAIPNSPPWPLPQTAGVERAQPEAVPPMSMAAYLARQSGFVCERPPLVRGSSHRSGPLHLLSCLLSSLSEPDAETPHVKALERLADRTGGLTDDNEGVRRLKLDGAADLPDLVQHIERSDLLLEPGVQQTSVAHPDAWRTVRETMFGLVDGGALPSGVVHPTRETDGKAKRLVWTDPRGAAPLHAPPDATDVLPEPEPEPGLDDAPLGQEVADGSESDGSESDESESDGSESDGSESGESESGECESDGSESDGSESDGSESDGSESDGSESDECESDGSESDGSESDGSESDGSESDGSESDGSESDEHDSDAQTGTAVEHATAQPVTPVERIVVEQRDTLMERLADAIRHGLSEAQRGFRQNCALVEVGTEYVDALKAQRRARRILGLLSLAMILVTVFALDQRWPYLADFWELLTPFEAERYYDPAVWPIGWFVIGALVLGVGLALLGLTARHMMESLRRLERISNDQDRFANLSSHYASEALRLYGIAQQFSDHRLIITEFLHRPFGHFVEDATGSLSAADLAFNSPPPHSMLVARAEVEPDKLDAAQKQRQESAVESGWLTDTYNRVESLWSERYRSRFVGDFQGPDHDATPRHKVLHRDRHDGSDVLGARTDFSQGVVFDPQIDGSGWAIHQTAADSVVSFSDSDDLVDEYLTLFGEIESVHGLQPGIDTTTFFMFAGHRHRFDWDDLLSPAANRPAEKTQHLQTQRYLLPVASQGRSLMVAWHLELSAPVRPEDQDGWRTTDDDDRPTETSRSVV